VRGAHPLRKASGRSARCRAGAPCTYDVDDLLMGYDMFFSAKPRAALCISGAAHHSDDAIRSPAVGHRSPVDQPVPASHARPLISQSHPSERTPPDGPQLPRAAKPSRGDRSQATDQRSYARPPMPSPRPSSMSPVHPDTSDLDDARRRPPASARSAAEQRTRTTDRPSTCAAVRSRSPRPPPRPPSGSIIVPIVTEDGELLAWGEGRHGHLGLGAVLHQQQPVRARGSEMFDNHHGYMEV